MDEFAEWPGKDLVVRESMTDTVPSAGVGTCLPIAPAIAGEQNPANKQ